MDSKTYNSILKTVCYADIFDYPLKEKEVGRWIKDPPASQARALRVGIKKANGVITHQNSFMFLKGREELIVKRMEREVISKQKLKIAKNIVKFLKFIPTIKLIGVSGSVAASNADRNDDIDFFIVAQKGTLWLTRFIATIVVEFFARRRRPNETNVADKICLNMFVDEKFLMIPKKRQNLYTAHEVCQLKALYNRDSAYEKFLAANRWVKKFLPNGVIGIRNQESGIRKKNVKSIIQNSLFIIPELIAKYLQLWYMRRHRTTEVISDGYLAFHPKDYTHDVLTAFEKRVNEYAAKV